MRNKQKIMLILTLMAAALTAKAQTPDTVQFDGFFSELKGVTIKGDMPNIRLKDNAIVVKVEGTALASAGTVGEMLVKVPGMTGSEESPEVLGRGNPLIYINGRMLRDMDELKQMRSEDIRDVEVIYNPGAQYDATVRAVVRIRTRKQQGDGFSMDLSATDEQDLRYGFNTPRGRLGINYRKNGWDLFGSVFYRHMDYRQYSTLEEKSITIDTTFCQRGPYTMTWENDQLTYTAGANWQISDSHSVGFRTDITHLIDGNNMIIYDEDIFVNDLLVDHLYSTQSSQVSAPLGWLSNAYYNGKVGKLGIDFNFDFLNSANNTSRENLEQSWLQTNTVRSSSGAESRLYASKLVFSYPMWKGNIDAGVEMSLAQRHNTYWIDMVTIANSDANIREDNIAAFAEYSRDFQKWGHATVGLRYEHTLFDYADPTNNDFLFRTQDELFPTAAYSVLLGKVHLSLSYGVKTNRPSFFAMNDAVTYISRYSLQAGNAQLLNERLHDLTLNASWKWLAFTTSYNRCLNAITQWAYITDDDAALIKHINLDKPVNNFSAYLSATPQVDFWSLNATIGVEKQDLWFTLDNPQEPGTTYTVYYDKPVFTFNAFNTFNLKYDCRVDLNFMFRSRGSQLNFYNDYNNMRLGVSVQKNMLKDKSLTVRLSVTDILQRNCMNEYSDMGYYQIRQNNRYSTHKLQLSVIYRLNPARSKYKGTGAGKEAQERMK